MLIISVLNKLLLIRMNYLLTGVKNNYINNIYAVLFCKMGSLESMPGVMMARDMLYFFV